MSNNGSYGNTERGVPALDADYNADPASGSFFHSDYKKHDDLKEMLDSNKDSLKLEAMKRIIGMVAKGRDASELFPAVVKNVVSKNIEVKKLVYVYLVRYAEEQQDLALLSISTFQRALKEPNQLIRAGALRVLSSIRVAMIVPIVMLAIRDAAADMSPYVRKTAAHAIPKLYSLDRDQKPELITIIERLLADRTTLVVGSAVMAFSEVCPERSDLVHKVYRKLCTLLVDVDEWGQVVILNMLTRYARLHFADPNLNVEDNDSNKSFYDSSSDTSDKNAPPTLDPDHRLLLRSARPLLQSRNSAVVMAVAQLYHHIAPRSEGLVAARALIRLLRHYPEIQMIVLDGIASISVQRKRMFEPFLKSFFVRTSDPTKVKLLKLEILTNLATECNVSVILRELRTYISNNDKQFVAATIQAIGRCACAINDVTDSCLSGLVLLLSNRDEAVVAESVVVIKRLLQTRWSEPGEIVAHMAKLLDNITVPQARAAILWLLGEHSHNVTHIAPDVLRRLAKSFCTEHDIVKLQVLNLAIKLYITNPAQTALLCQYVFNMARFDQNYDIRDRARLLKYFTQTSDTSKLISLAKAIFLAPKPAPLLQSKYKDRAQLQLGSLSHYINVRATGYQSLPHFPEEPPSGQVRDVEPIDGKTEMSTPLANKKKKKMIYSSASSGPDDTSDEEESSFEASEDEEDGSSEPAVEKSESEESDTESSFEESASDTSDSDEADKSEEAAKTIAVPSTKEKKTELPAKPKTNLDLLLDLVDDVPPAMTPIMTPSLGGFLTPMGTAPAISTTGIQPALPSFVSIKSIELLDRINGRGLSVNCRFTRSPHLFSSQMTNVGLVFTNSSQDIISDIKISNKHLAPGMTVHDFACIASLNPYCSLPGTLGIDFNDSSQPLTLTINSSVGNSNIIIKPTMGELLRAVTMSEGTFNTEQVKSKGMNEHNVTIPLNENLKLVQTVFETANVSLIQSAEPDIFKFAGQTLTSSTLVLATLVTKDQQLTITVNCEKIVVGSMLLNELKATLKR